MIALALTLVLAVATTSSGEQSATSAKKKCTKAAWKCAPKRYHLSADGTVAFSGGGSQVFEAEIDMKKWRASSGQVQYAQTGGTLTLRASWVGSGPTYELPTCASDVRFDVPEQALRLGKGDGFRFNAFLTFYLLDDRKNKYDFIVADDYELAKATGTETCLENSSKASFPYWLIASNNFTVLSPGRVGARKLKGSRSVRGDTLRWTLTRK